METISKDIRDLDAAYRQINDLIFKITAKTMGNEDAKNLAIYEAAKYSEQAKLAVQNAISVFEA